MRYILSPKAQADIEDIWNYTTANWSVDQAEAYIRELKTAVEIMAANPGQGRSCDEIRPGYHKYSVGSHVLFFRIVEGCIDVVRILHHRMDFDRHL